MAWAFVGSVFLVCSTGIAGQLLWFRFEERSRAHLDTAKLSATLEAELASMKDLKHSMQQLLLKNGFGR